MSPNKSQSQDEDESTLCVFFFMEVEAKLTYCIKSESVWFIHQDDKHTEKIGDEEPVEEPVLHRSAAIPESLPIFIFACL